MKMDFLLILFNDPFLFSVFNPLEYFIESATGDCLNLRFVCFCEMFLGFRFFSYLIFDFFFISFTPVDLL
jgi:hypothetical protein